VAKRVSDISNASDEDLAIAARTGSVDCFVELLNRYEKRVFYFVRRRIGNTHDAEDLTQEIFVKAYGNIARYRETFKFGVWLFTIARRMLISHLRRRGAMPATTDEPQSTADPSTIMEKVEEQKELWNSAADVLSEPQFAALWLKYREEMSVRQIAEILHRTPVHVKVLLHRARATLIARFGEKGGGNSR